MGLQGHRPASRRDRSASYPRTVSQVTLWTARGTAPRLAPPPPSRRPLPRTPPGCASHRWEACLLHGRAGDASVVVHARVAAARLLLGVGKGALRPVVHKSLGAGQHLQGAGREGFRGGGPGGAPPGSTDLPHGLRAEATCQSHPAGGGQRRAGLRRDRGGEAGGCQRGRAGPPQAGQPRLSTPHGAPSPPARLHRCHTKLVRREEGFRTLS